MAVTSPVACRTSSPEGILRAEEVLARATGASTLVLPSSSFCGGCFSWRCCWEGFFFFFLPPLLLLLLGALASAA